MAIQIFDIDGVIFMTKDIQGIRPYPEDIIITGRSYEEEQETLEMLSHKGITNKVYFNTIPYDEKTRESSGIHKGKTLQMLLAEGKNIVCIYEDDEIQIEQIKKYVDIPIVHIKHNLKDKENNRQGEFK
jgi:hypothetical protein